MATTHATSRQSGARFPMPGPQGHWWRGCLPQYQRDPLGFYVQMWREHGDYSRFPLGPWNYCYLLTHPDAVEHVLHQQARNYHKHPAIGLLFGDSVASSEGLAWRKQKRLAQPAFSRPSLARLSPLIVAAAERFVQEQAVTPGQPLNILEEMRRLILYVTGTLLFSTDLTAQTEVIFRALSTAFAYLHQRMDAPAFLPAWPWSATRRRFARSRQELAQVVQGVIATRRQTQEASEDVLAHLSAPDPETARPMPDRQLQENVLTLLMGGYEATTAALSWSWYLLAQHPAIQEDLYAEVHGRLQGRPPTPEDVPHLPLLQAVVDESMRLYPPFPSVTRVSGTADTIQGFEIPAHSRVLLCQWITHRHPAFWDHPDQFRPERFLSPSAPAHKFAYFPFGGGPFLCMGKGLALLENHLVIATILQQHRIRLLSDPAGARDTTISVQPQGGMIVALCPR